MKYLLALDQGTTSSRAVIFDAQGVLRGTSQREFSQYYPQPGWVEHDALEIWSTQSSVAAEAIAKAKISESDIAGIGITNQRETTILWDRTTGQPIAPAIVWQDRRTSDLCEKLQTLGHEPLFQKKTGLRLDPYFSGTKIRWILDHIPGARARAESGGLAFGTVDSWIVWNLTEGRCHITDASNASRTLLMNLQTLEWDDELLEILNIPRSILPHITACSGILGETSGAALPSGIPITGMAGDQQASLFGQRCVRSGMVKNTYGTGCFMLMHTGTQSVASRNRLLTTLAWKFADSTHYALEGGVFIGGAVVQWLRDGLGILRSSSEVESLAASVPDTGGATLVPAFVGLGAPHWDSEARGILTGITRGTTAAHLARAALESIAHQSADLLDAMEADSAIKLSELRVDGGAAANNLLMQFQADLLGVPVIRPKILESTALGVAFLAGRAVDFWENEALLDSISSVDRVFHPTMSRDQAAQLRTIWTRALERAKTRTS